MWLPRCEPRYHSTLPLPLHKYFMTGSGVLPRSSHRVWSSFCFVTKGYRGGIWTAGHIDATHGWPTVCMYACMFSDWQECSQLLFLFMLLPETVYLLLCAWIKNIWVLLWLQTCETAWVTQASSVKNRMRVTERGKRWCRQSNGPKRFCVPHNMPFHPRHLKYHSLCSAIALVNNPSLGATSESPAWSPAWWVPCHFRKRSLRRGEVVERGKSEERKGRVE